MKDFCTGALLGPHKSRRPQNSAIKIKKKIKSEVNLKKYILFYIHGLLDFFVFNTFIY